MLSCLNNECHRALVNWFARQVNQQYPSLYKSGNSHSYRYPVDDFRDKIALVHAFINHRVNRARHSKLGLPAAYESDWRMASAARVMALFSKLCFDVCHSKA